MTPANPTPQPLTMRELIEKADLKGRTASMMLYPQIEELNAARKELFSRCSPDTLRAVCDCLEGIINSTVHPDKAVQAVLVDLAPVRRCLSLLNGSPAQRS